MKRGLEIGPGARGLESNKQIAWDTVDSQPAPRGHAHFGSPQKFHNIRWGTDRLPQGDAYYDQVYTSHCIEHVPWYSTVPALREVFRVLKRGGLVEIWTLDMQALVDAYVRGECGDSWRRMNPEGDPFVWFIARIFAYGPPQGTMDNWHKSGWNGPHMRKRLKQAGFVDIRILGPHERKRGGAHGKCEFGAIARKP